MSKPSEPPTSQQRTSDSVRSSVGRAHPAQLSLEAYRAELVASDIIATDAIANHIASLPAERQPTDAQQLAQALVRAHLITAFQASAVFQGKGRNLLLGDYIVLDRVGAGGMGQVYKAQHRHMQRVVALKLLPAALARDQEAVRRFRREVQVAARLVHPHVVTAFDARFEPGSSYLAMEYVDGSDLSSVVKKNGPLAVDHCVHCILQAAKGLEYAHGEGVVHRDVKPGNLLLDKKGCVKILDLGLARLDEPGAGGEALTRTGNIMGTLDYMSPEQALDSKHADVSSDIYSLGCTLYYLLTGLPPYTGESPMARLLAHREAPIPSLCVIRDDVPVELDRVFQRMIAKQPEDRQGSMRELYVELSACLPGADKSLGQTAQFSIDSLSDSNLVTFLRSMPTGTREIRPVPTRPEDETFSGPFDQITPRPGSGSHRSSSKRRLATQRRKRTTAKHWIAGGAGLAAIGIISALVAFKAAPSLERPSSKSGPMRQAEVRRTPAPSATTRPAPPLAKAPFSADEALRQQRAWAAYLKQPVSWTNGLGMPLVLIPPGEFEMGATAAEIEEATANTPADDKEIRNPAEKFAAMGPRHHVKLTRPYFIGATPVTVAQFRRFVAATGYRTAAEVDGIGGRGKNAEGRGIGQRPDFVWSHPNDGEVVEHSPVTQVDWADAITLCNSLSTMEGLPPCYTFDSKVGWRLSDFDGYRLPSEAEWEFAARAGTEGRWCFGDNEALFDAYVTFRNVPTGSKLPNSFGVFDVHDGLQQWCHDYFDPHYYASSPAVDPAGPSVASQMATRGSRSGRRWSSLVAFRFGELPTERTHQLGMRVARGLGQIKAARAPPH